MSEAVKKESYEDIKKEVYERYQYGSIIATEILKLCERVILIVEVEARRETQKEEFELLREFISENVHYNLHYDKSLSDTQLKHVYEEILRVFDLFKETQMEELEKELKP